MRAADEPTGPPSVPGSVRGMPLACVHWPRAVSAPSVACGFDGATIIPNSTVRVRVSLAPAVAALAEIKFTTSSTTPSLVFRTIWYAGSAEIQSLSLSAKKASPRSGPPT